MINYEIYVKSAIFHTFQFSLGTFALSHNVCKIVSIFWVQNISTRGLLFPKYGINSSFVG